MRHPDGREATLSTLSIAAYTSQLPVIASKCLALILERLCGHAMPGAWAVSVFLDPDAGKVRLTASFMGTHVSDAVALTLQVIKRRLILAGRQIVARVSWRCRISGPD